MCWINNIDLVRSRPCEIDKRRRKIPGRPLLLSTDVPHDDKVADSAQKRRGGARHYSFYVARTARPWTMLRECESPRDRTRPNISFHLEKDPVAPRVYVSRSTQLGKGWSNLFETDSKSIVEDSKVEFSRWNRENILLYSYQ